jgi:hypothetical protein
MKDKLDSVTSDARSGIKLVLSRNTYLHNRAESADEGFKLHLIRLRQGMEDDVKFAQVRGGGYKPIHFDRAYEELLEKTILPHGSYSGQLKTLWMNKEIIRTATQVSTLGPHFNTSRIFEGVGLANKVNKTFGGVRLI